MSRRRLTRAVVGGAVGAVAGDLSVTALIATGARIPRLSRLLIGLWVGQVDPMPERCMPTFRAVSWTYDPYSSHVCEGLTTAGLPCRRTSRMAYEWPGEHHHLCGWHGRGLEPVIDGSLRWPGEAHGGVQ